MDERGTLGKSLSLARTRPGDIRERTEEAKSREPAPLPQAGVREITRSTAREIRRRAKSLWRRNHGIKPPTLLGIVNAVAVALLCLILWMIHAH
jgi:hypothetical protein